MAWLVPLKNIPYRVRAEEARLRALHGSRAAALDAASIEIIQAPGCYGTPFPATRGWVISQEAAEIYCAVRTPMPDGTSHRRRAWRIGWK